MTILIRTMKAATLAGVFATIAGCAGMGPMGDVLLGDAWARDVSGEVRRVDTRSRTIHVASARDGRITRLRYDNRTHVEYRNRRYSPTALERGDYVSVRVSRDRGGNLYADRVVVRQNARTRGRYDDRYGRPAIQRVDGQVASVNHSRGTFLLRSGQYGNVTVALPPNASRSDLERFRRLQRGSRVRVEGRFVSRGRLELVRFR